LEKIINNFYTFTIILFFSAHVSNQTWE